LEAAHDKLKTTEGYSETGSGKKLYEKNKNALAFVNVRIDVTQTELTKKREPLMKELLALRQDWHAKKSTLKDLQKDLGPSLFFRSKELKDLKNLEKTINSQFKDFTKNFEGAGRKDLDQVEKDMKGVYDDMNVMIHSIGLGDDATLPSLEKAMKTMRAARDTIKGIKEKHPDDRDVDTTADKLLKQAEKFIKEHSVEPTKKKLVKPTKLKNDAEVEMENLKKPETVDKQFTKVIDRLNQIRKEITNARAESNAAIFGLGDNNNMQKQIKELNDIKEQYSKTQSILDEVQKLLLLTTKK
jgi:hypothetical protein